MFCILYARHSGFKKIIGMNFIGLSSLEKIIDKNQFFFILVSLITQIHMVLSLITFTKWRHG